MCEREKLFNISFAIFPVFKVCDRIIFSQILGSNITTNTLVVPTRGCVLCSKTYSKFFENSTECLILQLVFVDGFSSKLADFIFRFCLISHGFWYLLLPSITSLIYGYGIVFLQVNYGIKHWSTAPTTEITEWDTALKIGFDEGALQLVPLVVFWPCFISCLYWSVSAHLAFRKQMTVGKFLVSVLLEKQNFSRGKLVDATGIALLPIDIWYEYIISEELFYKTLVFDVRVCSLFCF